MRFEREKPPDTATTTRCCVQVPRVAIGLNANITKIEIGHHASITNSGRISGPVHRSRSVRAVQRIRDHLPALPYRYGSSQLRAQTARRKDITRQWFIRYFINPSSRPLSVSAQRKQHISRYDRHVVVE